MEPRYTFASFDIVTVYISNVPIIETLEITGGTTITRRCIQEIISIPTRIILKHNYFEFNNKYFIGQDISAVVSSLFSII